MAERNVRPICMAQALQALLDQRLIHSTAEKPDRPAVEAARRMAARARHHMREAEPAVQALAGLLPFLRVVDVDRMEGKVTGGMTLRTLDGLYRWLGQSHHAMVVKPGKTSPTVYVTVAGPISEESE